MSGKVYVAVTVHYDSLGNMVPTAIEWEDGRIFEVDRILDVRPAASLKGGGRGIRYRCRILGKERDLWFEDPQWFVEGK